MSADALISQQEIEGKTVYGKTIVGTEQLRSLKKEELGQNRFS